MATLTGIRIKNFKAVGETPAELKLAPITLLYGPNGAGKSTVLHALHYAREILERGNLDPDRTLAGGELDLGGFRNLVHGRDLDRQIVLGFDLAVQDLGVDWTDALDAMGFSVDPRPLMAPHEIDRASVDLTIGWSPFFERPMIERCAIGLLGRSFAAFTATRDGANVFIEEIDFDHPVLDQPFAEKDETAHWGLRSALFGTESERVGVFGLSQALPKLDEPLHLDLDESTASKAEELMDDSDGRIARRELVAVMDYMSALLVGPLQQLREVLRGSVHIGPLRDVPPRGYKPQSTPDEGRWASGLAAWDRLAAMPPEEVEAVDDWLDRRLGSGFGVRLKRTRQIDADGLFAAAMARGPMIDDLETLAEQWRLLPEQARVVLRDTINQIDVEPSDIGVGVSQLLPIVVAALDAQARLVSVEQPELHVHPRLQTELGDLFVAAVEPPELTEDGANVAIPSLANPLDEADPLYGTNGRLFVIETHSEHLVLRLLRRIREAGEKQLEPGQPVVRPGLISVNYVEPGERGVRLHHLRVDETGEFIDRWPEGFFAERRKELF